MQDKITDEMLDATEELCYVVTKLHLRLRKEGYRMVEGKLRTPEEVATMEDKTSQ